MRHSYGRTVVLKKNYVDFNGFLRFRSKYSISDNHLFSSYFLLILAIFDSHKLPVNAYPEYQTKSHLVPLQLSVVWIHQARHGAPYSALQAVISQDFADLHISPSDGCYFKHISHYAIFVHGINGHNGCPAP